MLLTETSTRTNLSPDWMNAALWTVSQSLFLEDQEFSEVVSHVIIQMIRLPASQQLFTIIKPCSKLKLARLNL